ncbi:MAG TPA: M48 family metallopeptidase [Vicinamibacterales bacterium]
MNEDRAARYHRLRRRLAVLSTALGAGGLIAFLVSGWSVRLAAWSSGVAGAAVAIAIFTAVVVMGWELISLPLAFVRSFLLDRKYGLSSETVGTWAFDHAKALVIGSFLTIVAAIAVYSSMALWPRAWWVVATGLFAVAAMVFSRIAPVVLMPVFYRFTPLERESLRDRLLAMSQRAGIPVLGVFEWGLGQKTTRANAALVGMGRTRRILVSDTLLKDYSDDEVEVILAHELAHHVHHDLWTGLGVETAIAGASLAASDAALRWFGASFGIAHPSDVAGLPLLVLAGGTMSLLLTPLANAWSRRNERRADRFALDLTGRPAPFISAMRRLGAQNLAEQRPSRPAFWFFHTHPTIEERIAAARPFTSSEAN